MVMTQNEILSLLQRLGAVLTNDHFVYTSGKHGSDYVNKDAIYPHVRETGELCEMIANCFTGEPVDTVIAPAVGAVILAHRVADYLTRRKPPYPQNAVAGVYADKQDKNFVITRGYEKFVTDRNVLVVEDVLNTGGSALKVIEAVRSIKGKVIGVAALCNRGGVTEFHLAHVPKLASLVNVKMDMWDESQCPLCKAGVPINTEVGKGREFLARFKDQRVGK